MISALSDCIIVDLTTQLPGPYCSMLLADMGARIIKIEPVDGDPLRTFPPLFASVNRGKQSIAINLKKEAGREVLSRLFKQAHVVLEGFRPGVAARLGAGYDVSCAANSAMVYCSISGFGQEGPYRTRAGHDINYLSIGGMLDQATPPVAPPVLISDLSSGLYAALAVVAALTHRLKTGEGQYIDLSMTDCVLSWMAPEIARADAEGQASNNPLLSGLPHYDVFKTADGLFISLGIVYETHFWQRFCDLTGLTVWRDWSTEKRVAHTEKIKTRLKTIFSTATRDEWNYRLQAADIPCGPVNALDELANDPYIEHRDPFFDLTASDGFKSRQVRSPYRSSQATEHFPEPPPVLGEHTHSILIEAGYSVEEVGQMVEQGVVGRRGRSGEERKRGREEERGQEQKNH